MIRVKVSNRSLSGGPEIFRKNFINEVDRRDDISISDIKFDCELCFISFKRTHDKPILLRIDGCYVDKKRFGMNSSIVSSIRKSNYQIYQSEFSRKLFREMLNVDTSSSTVIHNGVDASVFTDVKWGSKEPLSFASCALWRANKRPNSIIRGFLKADIVGSVLYFIGNGEFEKIKDPRIKYLGDIKNSEVVKHLRSSKYYMNLSQMESCPNSVIEAILCGCRIISGSCGGTRELLSPDDIICDIDSNFNFKPYRDVRDSGFEDLISKSVIKSINTSFSNKRDRSRYSMKKCVDRYVSFMRSKLQ